MLLETEFAAVAGSIPMISMCWPIRSGKFRLKLLPSSLAHASLHYISLSRPVAGTVR